MPRFREGRYSFWRRRSDGLWVCEHERANAVLTQAATFLGDVVRGARGPLVVIGIGNDGTTPTTADDGLGNEVARALIPAPGTDTDAGKNLRTGDLVTLRVSFTGVNGWVREASVIGDVAAPPGAPGSGMAINHGLVGPANVGPSETFAIQLKMLYS